MSAIQIHTAFLLTLMLLPAPGWAAASAPLPDLPRTVGAAWMPTGPASDRRALLEAELARVAAACGGSVGVSAVDVETGERVESNADTFYPMASVCKLPLTVVVLRQVQTGTLRLDDPVRIGAEDYFPFYSPLRDSKKRAPANVPIRQLLEQVMIDSDNTANDVLLKVVGGAARLTAELRHLGIDGVTVERSEAEMAADFYGVGPAPAGGWTHTALKNAIGAASEPQHREASARFLADPRDTASPNALTSLLVKLAKGELVDAESTGFILSLMERCRTGNERLRAQVPASARVAEKTGTFPAIGTYNDVGIMRLPGGGRIAVAVLIKQGRDEESSERVIATTGRAVYEYFSAGAR